MSKRLALLIYTLLILGSLWVIFWQILGVSYDNCIIKNRSNYWLLTDRETIHKACRKRLNPFYL